MTDASFHLGVPAPAVPAPSDLLKFATIRASSSLSCYPPGGLAGHYGAWPAGGWDHSSCRRTGLSKASVYRAFGKNGGQ